MLSKLEDHLEQQCFRGSSLSGPLTTASEDGEVRDKRRRGGEADAGERSQNGEGQKA